MESLKEILAMILPLAGGFAGGVLGWCGSELTRHRSNKYAKVQVLNNALSWMLELYHQVNSVKNLRASTNDFIKWYSSCLAEKSMSKDDIQEVNKTLRQMLVPMFMSVVVEDLKNLSVNYEKAVGELSAYYPVIAYKLRGRSDIKQVIADMNIYCKKVEEQQSIPLEEYVNTFDSLQEIVQTTITQTNISGLRNEIIELSKETNCKHRKEILTTLDNIDQPDTQSVQYLELVKQQIMSHIQ